MKLYIGVHATDQQDNVPIIKLDLPCIFVADFDNFERTMNLLRIFPLAKLGSSEVERDLIY